MVQIDIVTWGSRIGKVDLDIRLVALVPGPRGPAAVSGQWGKLGRMGYGAVGRLREVT